MQKKQLTDDDVIKLIVFAAIIFGGTFRLLPPWLAGFPINDGGMFYTMMQDLIDNNLIPPLYTSYNHLNIPFAYPPLAFYIGAILNQAFKIPLLEILRWLPGLLSTACIPVFYFFAKEILGNKMQSAISTLAYASIPHLATWHIMGGGITRSLGLLFMLLTLTYVHRVYTREDKADIWKAILFGSLTTLSHTETPVYTIAIALFLFVLKSPTRKSILHSLMIAGGVFILAGTWYLWGAFHHGIQPFLAAGQTGQHSAFSIIGIIDTIEITKEPLANLLGILGILGILQLLLRRQYVIPGMMVVMFLVMPRSAQIAANIPLALGAGFFFYENFIKAETNTPSDFRRKSPIGAYYIAAIIVLCNSLVYSFQLSQKHLSSEELSTLRWIGQNTPTDSNFIIVTGEPNPFCDVTNEWFPAITERTSLNTVQGREWESDINFIKLVRHETDLQACIDENSECLLREATHFGQDYDYIYVTINSPTYNCLTPASEERSQRDLIDALAASANHILIRKTGNSAIFKIR
jgi:hypothetical protein